MLVRVYVKNITGAERVMFVIYLLFQLRLNISYSFIQISNILIRTELAALFFLPMSGIIQVGTFMHANYVMCKFMSGVNL